MSLKIADRVMETTNPAGVGSIILQGPVGGYRAFSDAFIDGDQVPYVISQNTQYEIGSGTLTAGASWTLTRDIIYTSSNGGAALNVTSGMLIFVDATKAYFDQVGLAETGDVNGPASSTDNAVVRFDGIDGKLVQDSQVTISDTGTVNIPAGQKYQINGADLSFDDIGGSPPASADAIVDSDFPSVGLMKANDGLGTYSTISDNSANWDAAYGWGDHSASGYLDIDENELTLERTGLDAEGIFTTLTYKRTDGTKYRVSTLSGASPLYNTRTVDYFTVADQVTPYKTISFTIAYDQNYNLISETRNP